MKRLYRTAVSAGAAALVLTAANAALLLGVRAIMAAGGEITDRTAIALLVILLALGVLHLIGAGNLIAQFGRMRTESFARSAAFALAFFSLFLLAVDAVILSDIGKEYKYGFDVSGEWSIVLAAQAVHALFAALLLIDGLVMRRETKEEAGEQAAVRDEALFLSVHAIGIVSAVTGALLMAAFCAAGVPNSSLNGLLFVLCAVALVPYGCIVLYWFLTKRKERLRDWYDEKQFSDLSRGALVTLVTTVLAGMVCYLLSALGAALNGAVYWFPAYLLGTLLLFSGTTLYLNKRV